MNWIASLGLVLVFFGLVLGTSLMLARSDTRRTVLALVLLGLIASGIKIWAFQHAPQWHDTNPDSITYDLNAKAFKAHWEGRPVDGATHNLRGLLAFYTAGVHGPEWGPNDQLSYASIIGSQEWLYTAYVATWYFFSDATRRVVIASNALWAAFLPAAAFGIALSLGATKRLALAAGGLALIDPSAGANASWMLKDTLASFLAMTTLWALLAYVTEKKTSRLAPAALALFALGGVRFGSFLGFVIAAGIICIWLISRKRHMHALAIAGVLSFAWLLQGIHSYAPNFASSSGKLINSSTPLQTINGGVGVLSASKGEASADESVLDWKNHLSTQPLHAIARSLSRTLFAPYPWVAIDPGLNWTSFSELYYPGTLLWIICLPGILTTALFAIRKNDPGLWLLLLFLASQFAAYSIWLGEWSTRQRVFALPAFFAMAVLGWGQLSSFLRPTKGKKS